MTRIKKMLVGFGLALGLLAIPLGTGAQTIEAAKNGYFNHRFYFSEEEVWRTDGEGVATYAMFELTDLERIIGRENLDWATIKFLEDNIWEYDAIADVAGDSDNTGEGVYDVDPDMFSEEIPWQDRSDGIANPAGGQDATSDGISGIDQGFFDEEAPWHGDPGIVAKPAGGRDETGSGIYGIDHGFFAYEYPWLGDTEAVANVAQAQPKGIFPHPDDVPQLRAGVLTY